MGYDTHWVSHHVCICVVILIALIVLGEWTIPLVPWIFTFGARWHAYLWITQVQTWTSECHSQLSKSTRSYSIHTTVTGSTSLFWSGSSLSRYQSQSGSFLFISNNSLTFCSILYSRFRRSLCRWLFETQVQCRWNSPCSSQDPSWRHALCSCVLSCICIYSTLSWKESAHICQWPWFKSGWYTSLWSQSSSYCISSRHGNFDDTIWWYWLWWNERFILGKWDKTCR